MQHEIKFQPSYALVVMQLAQGERVRCESGAMVSMSGTLSLEAAIGGKGGGGMLGRAFGALSRSVLGGESFFVTTISAENGPGEVTLAPATPGDVVAHPLAGRSLIVQGGAYLASDMDVEVNTQWGGLKGFLGGEGLFFLEVRGAGTVFLNSFGGIMERTLAAGERYIVDSGHMVAYENGMAMEPRMAGSKGGFLKRAITSATSGEGLVMEFTGPGTVWLQTRNPEAFSGWLATLLPDLTNNSS